MQKLTKNSKSPNTTLSKTPHLSGIIARHACKSCHFEEERKNEDFHKKNHPVRPQKTNRVVLKFMSAARLTLLDSSALDIKSLILSMAHREGLARQSAVINDGAEQIIFFHTCENKTDGVLTMSQGFHGFGAVNIVNRCALMRFDILINSSFKTIY